MAIALSTLVEEADRFLEAAKIQDYCPNGLQVEGRPQVRRIVSGVTASQALLDAAVAADADVVLVHHGYFWKGEDARVVGMKQRRLKTLLNNDISLLAYHLPLDLHADVGNNVQLGRQLGFEIEGPLEPGNPRSIVLVGSLAEPMLPSDLARHVRDVLGREPLLVDGGQPIRRIAWCTGAPRVTSTRPLPPASMPTSPGKFPSRPCTAPARTASASLPPGTTRPNAMACRPWATTWPSASPSSTCSSIARTRPDPSARQSSCRSERAREPWPCDWGCSRASSLLQVKLDPRGNEKGRLTEPAFLRVPQR